MRQPYGSTRQGKPHDVAMLGMWGPIRPHSSAQEVCLAGLAQQSWDIAVEKTAKRPWEARGTALGVIGCGDRVLRIAVNALIIMRLGAFWDYPRSWVSSFHQLWFWTTQCFIYFEATLSIFIVLFRHLAVLLNGPPEPEPCWSNWS